MTKTKPTKETEADFDVEAWLDQLDPEGLVVLDAAPLRAIGQALYAIEAAETQLEEAVEAAKAAGLSWGSIAMVLNTSKQAAHRKFGPKPAKVANAAKGSGDQGAAGRANAATSGCDGG